MNGDNIKTVLNVQKLKKLNSYGIVEDALIKNLDKKPAYAVCSLMSGKT